MDERKTVKAYYQDTDLEAERLREHEGRLERVRTCEIISRYLGDPPLRIADIGGATGAYAVWLAGMGHRVHLIDLTPKHPVLAREAASVAGVRLASSQVGDALHLPFAEDAFDVGLLMGPLYHLQAPEQRLAVIREAARVVEPDGYLFCAGISRYASLICGYVDDIIGDPDYRAIVDRDLTDGNHINHTDKPYFTDAHFHLPGELEQEITEAGLSCEALLAVEGFAWAMPGFNEKWEDETYRAQTLDYLRRLERDEALLGISAHFLAVCRAR